MIVYGHGLDIPHLDDTNSRWQSEVPLVPQRVVDPHSPLCGWSTDREHFGELWNFDDSSHTIQPSSLEAYSPRSVLRLTFFLLSNQCNMACSFGSSLWAEAQLVTCISTRTHPAATHTSFSMSWSPSIMTGLSVSALCVAPKVTPSRWVVIQLSASNTVLSHPFWYSNQRLNFTRDPTLWWPVASKLGVVIIYVKELLSVLNRKGW